MGINTVAIVLIVNVHSCRHCPPPLPLPPLPLPSIAQSSIPLPSQWLIAIFAVIVILVVLPLPLLAMTSSLLLLPQRPMSALTTNKMRKPTCGSIPATQYDEFVRCFSGWLGGNSQPWSNSLGTRGVQVMYVLSVPGGGGGSLTHALVGT